VDTKARLNQFVDRRLASPHRSGSVQNEESFQIPDCEEMEWESSPDDDVKSKSSEGDGYNKDPNKEAETLSIDQLEMVVDFLTKGAPFERFKQNLRCFVHPARSSMQGVEKASEDTETVPTDNEYLVHCSRVTDGFDFSMKRDEHEAAHQRKYRCVYPSCALFSTGFATESALNQHISKYHPTLVHGKDDTNTISYDIPDKPSIITENRIAPELADPPLANDSGYGSIRYSSSAVIYARRERSK
jgi:hypothetical protein